MAEIVDIIAKLGVDAKGVYDELDKVNAKYKQVSQVIRDQEEELAKLQAKEQELLKNRAKVNNPSVAAQYNQKLEETRGKISKINEELKKQTKELNDASIQSKKLDDNLRKAFDGTKIKSANAELKKTESSLSSMAGTLIAGVGLTTLGSKVIEVTAEFEKFEAVLVNTLGSQSLAKQALDGIKEFAEKTPFSVAELTESFVKLANQGFVPTTEELRKLGDIASSQGKSFNQLTEAIIDAQTGEFERLKEFGIRASKEGDKVAFTFKGVKQEVDFTNDSIRNYILNLGDAQGVSGSMAAISETLGGQISNLGDAWDSFLNTLGENTKPVLSAAIDSLKLLLEGAKGFVSDLGSIFGGNLAESTAKSFIERSSNILTGEDAKRLAELGFSIDNFTQLTDREKDVIQFAEALKQYNDTIIENKADTESVSEITSIYFNMLKETQKAYNEGAISGEDYAVKVNLINDAIIKAQDAQALYNETQEQGTVLTDEQIKAQQKAAAERLAISKKLRDLEVANITDETERRRAELTTRFNDEVDAAKGNADIIRELNIKLANDLKKIDDDILKKRKEKLEKAVKLQEEYNNEVLNEMLKDEEERKSSLERALSEEQRHQTAMLEIKLAGNEDANSYLYANELYWEKLKLAQIEEFYGKESEEYKKQANKIEELTAKHNAELNKLDKKRAEEVINNLKTIVDASIDAAEKVISAKISEIDKLSSLQQKRVDDAQKIAEKGNAELLELEKERLDKLTKERENYVRAQQTLASIELIANTAVTVSKAAAQGGAAAGVTIAAALIALVAGLASARSIAGQAAFYEGGLYDGEGYTGDGNPREVSNKVGRKPYTYHKQEFIHNHQTTKKYREIFQAVHEGKIDLNQMKFESDMYKMLNASGMNTSRDIRYNSIAGSSINLNELKGKLDDVRNAIERQEGASFHVDEKGIYGIYRRHLRDKQRIDNIAR